MTKTYKANNSISINVVLPGMKNRHVSFTALSDGSSYFVTSDEVLQKAIEKHYNFNILFRLEEEQEVEASAPTEVENTDEQSNETALRKVSVTDIASAKDYLADTFGISRTAMRSTKSILEQAAAHGIEFEGI